MNNKEICDRLGSGLGELFTCADQGEYCRIRTPYLYPDGDNIDLFCRIQDDAAIVTDLAETTGWLRMQSTSQRRSLGQNRMIEDACQTHGVEFHRGMLQARCRSDEPLAAVVMRVAQAALRISDLWFTFRTKAITSVTDEVADYLADKKLPFSRSEKLCGRSGRNWTVDFRVRAVERSSLVYVLATGSRSSAHRITEHVLSAWHDLHHLASGPEALSFVSLFDDTSDVWREEDTRLMEPLSIVSHWSRPDEFAQALSVV